MQIKYTYILIIDFSVYIFYDQIELNLTALPYVYTKELNIYRKQGRENAHTTVFNCFILSNIVDRIINRKYISKQSRILKGNFR